jgi:conjugative transfer pilus assembly protein TraH
MRNRTLLALICLALFMARPAQAGLDSELNGMFNDMINITDAGAYQTQRRGVITGGSLSTRNKIITPHLISFVPPDVKAGCNGIDLFAGSFSFINSAQFTQLARSIAQAAVGYAFQLAIEGMCPTCAQIISKLQSDIAKLNDHLRNSCEAGKAIVDSTGLGPTIRAWADERKKNASTISTGIGIVDDYFKSAEMSTDPPAKTLMQHGKTNEITGNVVYQALSTSNAALWFANSDEQMKMVMMSLTGTLIISPKSDHSDVKFDTRPAILNARDFIEGGQVTIYDCESAACLLPIGNKKEITLEGMRPKIRKMLFGTGMGPTGTGGIVRKIASKINADGFTADEKKFIAATSPGVYGMLRRLSTEIGTSSLIADRSVDIQATELTNKFIEDMFDVVRNAVVGTGKPMDSSMLQVMRDKKEQINAERAIANNAIAGVNTLISLQASLVKSLREPLNNKVH